MQHDELVATARAWMQLWSGAPRDAFEALHHPDFVDHASAGRAPDRESFRQALEQLYQAFPDFCATIEDLVVDTKARKVTVRWTATGTHRGDFLAIAPTGQRIAFSGIELIEVRDGQVLARWGEWDGLELAAQLRAAPEASASPETPQAGAGARPVLTILAVDDLQRAATFYREAFAWPVRVDVPVYVELALPDGRGLGVYQREAFARNTGQLPSVVPAGMITATELYLHCADLDGAITRLQAAGARELSARAPRPWGDEAAYFADPDGNVLVVARPLAATQQDV